jgi:hypothetical protein
MPTSCTVLLDQDTDVLVLADWIGNSLHRHSSARRAPGIGHHSFLSGIG